MALTTYAGLKSSVASWLHRDDLTSIIPDFIALAEARIARDLRIRKQVTNTTLATVGGTQYVTLPTDFLEMENIGLSDTSPPAQLHVVTPEVMDELYPAGYSTAQPVVYTIVGDKLLLGPTPDAVYTVTLDYYARFAALSGASDTNWLLTYHPGIYLFGSLAEAMPWVDNKETISLYEQKYMAEVEKLNLQDDESLRTGSAMRVRKM
ncbi:MAG: hypothetical protein RLZZ182_2546 [Pseudomonadota bacterium]|jgi:hypothetical protein